MRFLIIIFLLSSCSAQYHLNKAVKKGAELETVDVYLYDTITDTVENKIYIRTKVTDTIQKTLVKYVPKTRWQTRIEYKYLYRFNRDSLRHVQKLYRDSIQVEKKKLSNEKNKNNRLNRFLYSAMAFFILILICYIAIRIVASKLLK